MKEEGKCIYCDIEEGDMVAEEWLVTIDEQLGRMIAALDAIVVNDINEGPAIGLTLGDIIDEIIPINYCPKCGRKLR